MKRILAAAAALLVALAGGPAWPQVAISHLPAAAALTGAEVLPAVQATTTVKVTADQIGTRTAATMKNANNTWAGVNTFSAGSIQLPAFSVLAGATSSFPALKRNGVSIEARLADDSAYTGFVAHNFSTDGNVGTGLYFAGNGSFQMQANGVFGLFDFAATSFGRLQFGGTTSAYPALKRASAAIQVRLADDSAYADLYSNNLILAPAASLFFTSRGSVTAVSDGVFLLWNTATTDFSRLQFGGTTSAYPALRRSGVSLEAVLADASAYTSFVAQTMRTIPVIVAALPTCNAGADATRSFVDDATVTTFASAVVGGGSNHVPVYCDGGAAAWKIG